MQRLLALLLLLGIFPLYPIFFLCIKFTSPGPFVFRQKRIGKDKIPFTIYKFRTMVAEAETLKARYLKLNEADGPVFKIRSDPRYTSFGKILAHSGLDELPQLINIAKGEMAFVGPRPLPTYEAKKIPSKYNARFSVLPGLTSPWVVKGSHKLSFDQWMKLDIKYVNEKNIWYNIKIIIKTALIILRIA